MIKYFKKFITFILIIAIFSINLTFSNAVDDNLEQIDIKSITPSSTLTLRGKVYNVSRAFDGDYDTSWYASQTEDEAYLILEFDELSEISKLNVYWGIYDYPKNYEIYCSEVDNPTEYDWREANVVSKTNTMYKAHYVSEISLEEENVKCIKIYCKDKNDWSYEVFEILAYGKSNQSNIKDDNQDLGNTSEYQVQREENHAYLPCEWFDSKDLLTEKQIEQKLDTLENNKIKYLFCDIGILNVNNVDGKIEIADNIDYDQLALWIKLAQKREMKVSACINCVVNDNFNELYSNNVKYGEIVKQKITSTSNKLLNQGLYYDGSYYFVDGIHLDMEPFISSYQDYFIDVLKSVKSVVKENNMLSVFSPCKNGIWSEKYLMQVVNIVDMINPGVYDTNGPDYWGTYEQGVTQTKSEYIKLVEDTCIWYSNIIESSENPECKLSLTSPVYEDKGCKVSSDVPGFPYINSNMIYYHCNYNKVTNEELETLRNHITGVNNAIEKGANVYSCGIFYWPAYIGESGAYKISINPYYDYSSDQLYWRDLWIQEDNI